MNFVKTALLAAGILGAVGANAAQITLNNNGFEAGLTGWNTLGTVVATPSTSVTTYNGVNWTVNANGTTMAQINSGPGVSIASIESTLGVASGTLQALNPPPAGGDLTQGSALYQSFTGAAGDTLSFAWNYVAVDYIPFNDPAFALLIGPSNSFQVLASIYGAGTAVGTAGNSGWQNYSATLAVGGSYTLAFVTTDDKDKIYKSVLHIDAAAGTCVPNCPPVGVPEPGTLAIVGLGIAGLSVMRKRKQA